MRPHLPARAEIDFFGNGKDDRMQTFGISVYIGDERSDVRARFYTPLHERIHNTVRDMIQNR